MIELKEHLGVILKPSSQGFDNGASTFCCLFKEPINKDYYLYYTGSDVKWNKASIGVATSKDGVNFVKYSGNPLVSVGKESVTPVLFGKKKDYWMIFAFKPNNNALGRRLGIAVADNPLGPWKFVKQLAKPEARWEGNDIDAGPSVVMLSEAELLVFYSNVSNRSSLWSRARALGSIFGTSCWKRQIGLMKLRISEPKNVAEEKWNMNPLSHLNGPKGSWNESLFCPGYFSLGKRHYLVPAASTYSIGFPYKQYIGLFEDSSPFFEHPNFKQILINGPKEKNLLLNTKGEVALDTPSPIVRGNALWLYYSIMDRADGIWKTALSIFSIT
jgi:hypothetical protein